jgi:tRNA-binding protein
MEQDMTGSAGGAVGGADDQREAGHPSPPVPELRVARVTEAMEHPNADRLLVLRIHLGTEERQIVAGIRGHYEPPDLVGRSIVVLVNLQHAKLRGEWSQAMLLAAESEDGRLGLLLAPDAEPGTPVGIAGGPAPHPEITFAGFHENTLLATPEGVTLNGALVQGARLVMDREVYGRLK